MLEGKNFFLLITLSKTKEGKMLEHKPIIYLLRYMLKKA